MKASKCYYAKEYYRA